MNKVDFCQLCLNELRLCVKRRTEAAKGQKVVFLSQNSNTQQHSYLGGDGDRSTFCALGGTRR